MNGYRHLSIQPCILFQVRIRDVQASCSRNWDLAPRLPLKESWSWWAFWGRFGTVLSQQPALPLHARLDLWLCLESTQNISMSIMAFFFFQICSNTGVLELSQRLQICVKQEEVTLRPKGKLKMPTFTQLLVKTLSQNKETECVKTHCTHPRRLFKKNKQVRSGWRVNTWPSNKCKTDESGRNGGGGKRR